MREHDGRQKRLAGLEPLEQLAPAQAWQPLFHDQATGLRGGEDVEKPFRGAVQLRPQLHGGRNCRDGLADSRIGIDDEDHRFTGHREGPCGLGQIGFASRAARRAAVRLGRFELPTYGLGNRCSIP